MRPTVSLRLISVDPIIPLLLQILPFFMLSLHFRHSLPEVQTDLQLFQQYMCAELPVKILQFY
jgi:hypothetical protein